MGINLNKMARDIALIEGKKVNLSIAQIKEVLRIVIMEIKKASLKDLVELLNRVK